MLSIGLAPGLTNLLAAHAHRLLDEVTELDIFIMLGLGDRHGKAAMEWICKRIAPIDGAGPGENLSSGPKG